MKLPNGTGADLSLQIRSFDLETPILLLTDEIDQDDRQGRRERVRKGVYLITPGGIDELGETVARLLKNANRSS
jgi:DNA-binding response OmpR family regulator